MLLYIQYFLIGRYTSGLYHVEMHFTLLGPPQLRYPSAFFSKAFCWAPPQLALSVGFLFESLLLGPSPACVRRLSFRKPFLAPPSLRCPSAFFSKAFCWAPASGVCFCMWGVFCMSGMFCHSEAFSY